MIRPFAVDVNSAALWVFSERTHIDYGLICHWRLERNIAKFSCESRWKWCIKYTILIKRAGVVLVMLCLWVLFRDCKFLLKDELELLFKHNHQLDGHIHNGVACAARKVSHSTSPHHRHVKIGDDICWQVPRTHSISRHSFNKISFPTINTTLDDVGYTREIGNFFYACSPLVVQPLT